MTSYQATQHDTRDGHSHGAGGVALAIDPICQMSVDPATAKHHAEHDGADYYFCAPGCKKAFVADPQRYLAPSPAASRFELPMLRLGHGGCGDSCSCG